MASGLLDEILTEKELIEFLGLKRGALDELRATRKLPFCRLNRMNRVYLVADVLEFIKRTRVVLDKDS
ncbi:MAG: hypothetical protein ABIB65_01500 [Candidatus Margulisiibacteriota bacterium]